jgi:uncharacterized protein (DUF427 family)
MTDSFTVSPRSSEYEPSPRWVRVYFNGEPIADSKNVMLLRESDRLPLYYFPKKDVRMDCLQSSDRTARSDFKGEGVFWHVQIGDRVSEDAAFTFRNPPNNGPNLQQHIAFVWNKMDAWFEEDEEVFVYARDPYKRIDVMPSSRHIKVVIDDIEVADTKRPRLLFETGLPTRYYITKHDVRMDLLELSDTVSHCPYKGDANYYSIKIDDTLHKDVVWFYRYPAPDSAKVQGLLGFLNEKVDIYEDAELLPRPKSAWS